MKPTHLRVVREHERALRDHVQAVLADDEITVPVQRHLLLVLALHADDRGVVDVAPEQLMRELGWPRDVLVRATHDLVNAGRLAVFGPRVRLYL